MIRAQGLGFLGVFGLKQEGSGYTGYTLLAANMERAKGPS